MRTRNHVVVTGREDGPAVLLAHGFGCDRNLWRLVAPDLAERSAAPARTHGRARYSEEQLRADLTGLAPASTPSVETVTGLLAGFGDGVEDDTALLASSIPQPGGVQP